MNRVVVTGLGIISPVGTGKDAYWRSIASGKSGLKHLSKVTSTPLYERFDFASQVVGEVEDFDPVSAGLPEEVRGLDRYIQFAVAAATQALSDADLDPAATDRDRVGISLSTAICGTRQMEAEFVTVTDNGTQAIDPAKASHDLYLASMSNTPAIILAAMTGAHGPVTTLSTGCIGGIDAVGYAFEAIAYGEADVMLAGASEAPITPITTAAFEVISCLSRRHNHHPEAASRPFDAERDGFVLAEGSAVLVLESIEHAEARQARIYAEITGFGLTCNALHMTDLLSDGAELASAMIGSLAQANAKPADVDHVNAHGSSTPQNDSCETKAIVTALGDRARDVPVNGLKSMTGHPLAAASALEIAASVLTFTHGFVPPTINYQTPDPQCDLDYVPNEGRPWDGRIILTDASGFSGLHAAMTLQRTGDGK